MRILSRSYLDVIRGDTLQEVNVLFTVESAHVVGSGLVGPIDLHLLVQVVLHHQAMNDAEPVRLHGVSRTIVEVSHVRVVKVGHSLRHRQVFPCYWKAGKRLIWGF